MKSVQRKMGTFMKRSENEADVDTVMKEFRAADDMLDRMVKDITAWRNAWEDILKFQYDASEAFAEIYKPIEATGEDADYQQHRPAQTPANNLQKCLGLQKDYSDEKLDLAHEIELITSKLLRPATDAKESTKLLHKTLKHRDNMKLDYERYLSRAEHARKKEARTLKEETALQTHEANLAQSRIDYQTADEQVKQTFPSVTAAVVSLLPYLLAHQVQLQTTLVGQLYTVLDAYTKKFGFANPAPANTEIIRAFEQEFTPLRKEMESGLPVLAQGRVVHMTMNLPPEKDKSTVTGLGIRNKVMSKKETKPTGLGGGITRVDTGQGSSQQAIEDAEEAPPPKPPRPGGMSSPNMSPSTFVSNKPRIGSNASTPANGMLYRTPSAQQDQQAPPPYDYKPTALTPGYPNQASEQATGSETPPSRYQTPVNGSSPLPQAEKNADYFGNRRPSQASSITSSAASIAAGKKKPPPPVPAKRLPSMQTQYVTALYDFEGQNPGDLAFREGDKIRVVKKTDDVNDWWDGELRGVAGVFPANYVQL